MSLIAQLLIYGVLAAAIFSLVAVGFYLIFSIVRFFHFAHAAVFTCGAYSVFLLNARCGLPLFFAILVAVVLCSLLGCAMYLAVYRPLRRKGTSSLILLLASLGLYAVFQNLISLAFGDDTKTIRTGAVTEGMNLLGARITSIQVTIVCFSIALVVGVWIFLKRTKIGMVMRAVADDLELARVSGIDSDRIILWTFAISSALAGIAGILVAFDTDMTPTMGLNVLLMGVVAVIIGGSGSIPGVALGALFLGLAQHLGVWGISSQWQDAIAFIILLAFLLVRPEGVLGKRVTKATV